MDAIPSPRSGIRNRHIVPVPPLCRVSGEPTEGTVEIVYEADDTMLDVMQLPDFVASFAETTQARDLEWFVVEVARSASAALGVEVATRGVFRLADGQELHSEAVLLERVDVTNVTPPKKEAAVTQHRSAAG